jgi:predicted dehydrogenase
MLRIGVIGCGPWGKNYVRTFNERPGARVLRAADLVRTNLDFLVERDPQLAVSREYGDVLTDPRIDAVVVATPAATHFEIAREAIAHGKHLIVEKPLALDVAECEELTRRAVERGVVLMVGHTFLFNDSVVKIKELLESGDTGAVYYLTARRNHLGKIREDVSVLWDLPAHDISIFSYLLGEEPAAVSAVGGCYLREGREDVTFLTLRYPGGAVGHVQTSWIDASKIREIVVITGRRRIEFDDLDPLESVRVYEKGITAERDVESFGEFNYRLRDGDILSPRIERREPLRNLCQHFLDCVSEAKPPRADGTNGTNVVRVLKAAEASLARRGAEVPVSAQAAERREGSR